MNPQRVYTCSPSWTLLPPPSPYHHPSGSFQCTSPKHPVSCIEPGLAICFIYDIIHVSVPFSQIIPPSPTESKRLFYTSVSLLLSRIQGYHYHLSKFHIYVWRFLKKLEIELPYDPAIPMLGIHTEETELKETRVPQCSSQLFIIARTWKQPRCPLADEWIRKLWYIYTMEYITQPLIHLIHLNQF